MGVWAFGKRDKVNLFCFLAFQDSGWLSDNTANAKWKHGKSSVFELGG